jgi:hypothetical protein
MIYQAIENTEIIGHVTRNGETENDVKSILKCLETIPISKADSM